MANAVNVNFRMDPDLKRSMEEVCAEIVHDIDTGKAKLTEHDLIEVD